MKNVALAALFAACLAGPAMAQNAPAVTFDVGGKFDRSFNQAAYDGAEKFKKETGVQYAEFEVRNAAEREQSIRNLARRGASVVVAVGFNNRSAVETVAREFPNVKFTIIDSVVELPNVQSVVFREHEGSFLVGMLAAMASKSGKVGFVGGMDIPLIRKFYKGYEEGAKFANPKADVLMNMTGTTPAAFNDPTRGAELARGQFDRGVDVVYAAAGATGLGVYQAAKDAHKLAIGVDSNQDHLHPGTMLSSMIKRVDVAVYNAMIGARNGTWKAGVTVLGLKEEGVGWSLDEFNRKLVTPEMEKKVNEARAAIIAGKIKVTDVTAAR
ncbi:MAG: BMP family ABC transporter substrate-binding protein [Alphaproteobacteria bacterium]|nr:BMP family ABC transporter substrate-binding protein [Alphaproteobacteria bacterium]